MANTSAQDDKGSEKWGVNKIVARNQKLELNSCSQLDEYSRALQEWAQLEKCFHAALNSDTGLVEVHKLAVDFVPLLTVIGFSSLPGLSPI